MFLSLLHPATATWHPSTLAGEGPASLDLLRNVTASVQISQVTVGSSADVLAVLPRRFVTLSNVSTDKLSGGQSSDVAAKASRQVCQKSPSVCPLVPNAPPHHAGKGDRYAIRCPGPRTGAAMGCEAPRPFLGAGNAPLVAAIQTKRCRAPRRSSLERRAPPPLSHDFRQPACGAAAADCASRL